MAQTQIAIVGGDRRELYLAEFLAKTGYGIRLCGYEKYPNLPGVNHQDPLQAIEGVQAVILPLAGIKEDYTPNCPFSEQPPLLDSKFFAALSEGTPVFIGWAREGLRALAKAVQLVEVAGDDELAILNSIPTAEGAIAIAMEGTDVTIHGSSALVIGFGRCGISLARMLGGIGARVTVAARKATDFARAFEMGFNSCHLDDLMENIDTIEFIFNTVPAFILNDKILANAHECKIIVDIASGRGGTDFEFCKANNIPAVLAPGLPGKVAPVTAGKILARVYPRFLQQYGVNRR